MSWPSQRTGTQESEYAPNDPNLRSSLRIYAFETDPVTEGWSHAPSLQHRAFYAKVVFLVINAEGFDCECNGDNEMVRRLASQPSFLPTLIITGADRVRHQVKNLLDRKSGQVRRVRIPPTIVQMARIKHRYQSRGNFERNGDLTSITSAETRPTGTSDS